VITVMYLPEHNRAETLWNDEGSCLPFPWVKHLLWLLLVWQLQQQSIVIAAIRWQLICTRRY